MSRVNRLVMMGFLWLLMLPWLSLGGQPTSLQSSFSDWGTYNPGVFIGLRSKLSSHTEVEDLEVGVVWGTPKKLRHAANEDSVSFSYIYNDPGSFAVQRIKDPQFAVELNSTFIADTSDADSFQLSLDGLHVGRTKYDVQAHTFSVFLYVKYLRSSEGCSFVYKAPDWVLTCNSKPISRISFAFTGQGAPHSPIFYAGLKVANYHLAEVSKFIVNSLNVIPELSATFSNSIQPHSNLLLLQAVVKAPFSLKLSYNSPSALPSIAALTSGFIDKFTERFGQVDEEKSGFGMDVLSNLLGGIGLFNGPIRVKDGKGVDAIQKQKLFTGSPSRHAYPRGFLWDEGFHLLVTCQWSTDLCVEILDSWLRTMDDKGWIAREQIRGYDAEERVPKEYLVQDQQIANPPTLLLPIAKLMEKVKNISPVLRENDAVYKSLKRFYPSLQKWFRWLQTTQVNSEGAPMWKGRTLYHNLASGLDDYPRGLMPSELERHLDLQCWLVLFAETLETLAEVIGEAEDALILRATLSNYKLDLQRLFWDDAKGRFSDFLGEQFMKKEWPAHLWREDKRCGRGQPNAFAEPAICNPYSDAPCCSKFGWCGNGPQFCLCEGCQSAPRLESLRDLVKARKFSPHEGYVTLFPLIIGEVDQASPAFTYILDLIESDDKLWSASGLRSLSASDLLYRQGEGYWRGPIWLNINYLVWRALKAHYPTHIRAQELAGKLKDVLVKTVYSEWKKSGWLWEQYNDQTGRGQRVHPFYGWSSLVLLVMQDIY
jgi:mannosyl-oligosaccharide glucosidase